MNMTRYLLVLGLTALAGGGCSKETSAPAAGEWRRKAGARL